MKRNVLALFVAGSLIVLAAFVTSFVAPGATSVEAQGAYPCDAGKECAWINVSNVTSFGIAPSASAQGFYNTQATKDQLCKVSGYENNPGYSWAVQQASWDSCNAEYHIDWRGRWDIHKCGGTSYMTQVYCARNKPVPPSPKVDISVNPDVVRWGNTTSISWSGENVSSCTASGDWSGSKATTGAEESGIFVIGNKTFNISCETAGGETVSDSATARLDFLPRSPTIEWVISPSVIGSGDAYYVSAIGRDPDGDLTKVEVLKDGQEFASTFGGDGFSSTAQNLTGDMGPKTITFTAQATDGTTRRSPQISHSVTIAKPIVNDPVTPSAPTVRWTMMPGTVDSGSTYRVEAVGYDNDTDLIKVSVDKDNAAFAYSGGGNGFSSIATNETTDLGPRNVTYKAWAEDAKGNKSDVITGTVAVAPPVLSVSASASASPSCVQPGGTITVNGTASGTGITSNVLEKDSNLDGSFGSIASRSDAGATSATVSVPSSETSGRYDFRVSVNGGAQKSNTASVTISSSCGGERPWYCSVIPSMCAGDPGNPSTPSNPPSVSINASASCVVPNTLVTLTSNANGSPINSNIIQKDSPASNSEYGDGVFGTVADYGSSGGTHTFMTTIGSVGYYDFRAVVNDSASASTRIRSSPSCGGQVPNPWNPGVGNNNVGGNSGGGGGGNVVLLCTNPTAVNFNQPLPCRLPEFTLSTTPSSVKAKSIAGYSGVIEQDVRISVNPVSGFNSSVSVQVVAYPPETKPEFSFDGGVTYSTNPTATLVFDGSFHRFNGLISLPVKIRFTGKLERRSDYVITFQGTGIGGNGSGKTAVTSVTIDSQPLFPDFREL